MASVFVLLMLACVALASTAAGLGVGLKRIHSDNHRELASLDQTLTASTRKDYREGGAYVMSLSIGTPPLPSLARINTGSTLIVMHCADEQSSSETLADLPCNSTLRQLLCAADDGSSGCPLCMYNQTYEKGYAFVTMATENFTFDGEASIPGIAFGCINKTSDGWEQGSSGLVGMGWGNLSLVSQLSASKFSYCLTPFRDANSTSTLQIGPSAAINGTGAIQSTPFVPNPSRFPSYYYLNLTGISIGTTPLSSIPTDAFALNPDGTGGLIIDSGWTTTTLVDVAYQEVRAEVLNQVALPPSNKTTDGGLCFDLPAKAPDMTLHFDGGADMVLPADNYMSLYDSGLWCLNMDNATAAHGSVLGNYQQQNMHILYDIENGVLSFAPADCTTL